MSLCHNPSYSKFWNDCKEVKLYVFCATKHFACQTSQKKSSIQTNIIIIWHAYAWQGHIWCPVTGVRKGWFSNTSFTTGLKTLPTFRPDALVFFRAKMRCWHGMYKTCFPDSRLSSYTVSMGMCHCFSCMSTIGVAAKVKLYHSPACFQS